MKIKSMFLASALFMLGACGSGDKKTSEIVHESSFVLNIDDALTTGSETLPVDVDATCPPGITAEVVNKMTLLSDLKVYKDQQLSTQFSDGETWDDAYYFFDAGLFEALTNGAVSVGATFRHTDSFVSDKSEKFSLEFDFDDGTNTADIGFRFTKVSDTAFNGTVTFTNDTPVTCKLNASLLKK